MMKKGFLHAAVAAFLAVPAIVFAEESAPAPNCAETVSAEDAAAETRISRVVVFPQGARVTRSAKIRLRAGEQEIVLAGVPAQVRNDSLSAETRIAGARVAAVSSELRFSAPADAAAVAAAKEKLDRARCARVDLEYRLAEAEARLRDLEQFRPFGADGRTPAWKQPAAHTAGKTTDAPPFPPAFNAVAALRTLDFLEKSSGEAILDVVRLKKERDLAALDLEIAESEYRKLAAYVRTSERVVRVKILADEDAEGEIAVNYMTDAAQWRPGYDLHVDPATKSATLVSYGVVSQRTGEDWDGVPVTLSTARPDVSADLPKFRKILVTERFAPAGYTSAVGFGGGSGGIGKGVGPGIGPAGSSRKNSSAEKAEPQQSAARLVLSNAGTNSVVFEDGGSADGVLDVQYQSGNYIFKTGDGVLRKVSAKNVRSLSQNIVETETGSVPTARLRDPSRDLRGLDLRYELARAETIKSTGTPHRYLLASENFSGDFYCKIAPSVNAHAYQMLEVTNGNFRPILAGPANVFYGADFIGDIDVPYTVRAGTVRIPLGVDPRISVERRKINDIETVGTFTSSRRNSVSVSIKIRNRTPKPVRVVCDEAVPVSTMKEIEVSAPKFSPAAEFAEETGLARWIETIAPAQEIELRAEYEIEYPRNFALEEHSR